MATVIARFCDVEYAQDPPVQVDAQQVTVSLNNGQNRTLDLCEQHERMLLGRGGQPHELTRALQKACSVMLPGDGSGPAPAHAGLLTSSGTSPRCCLAAARVADQFLLGLSPATARAYASDLLCASTYAGSQGRCLLSFSRTDLELYGWELVNRRRLRPATVARRLAALSGYFGEAVADGHLPRNPMRSVRRPRVPSQTPVLGFDRDELRALLGAAKEHSPRAWALTSLLAFTGARIGEVLGADVGDLGHQRGVDTLQVVRKGGHVVAMPIPPTVASAVGMYLDGRSTGPLIGSRSGRRLDRGNAGRILKAVAIDALGSREAARVHPHRFRHAWVAGLLDAGVPLHEVQRAAGHASPTTTLKYDRARQDVHLRAPSLRMAAWLDVKPENKSPAGRLPSHSEVDRRGTASGDAP